MKTIDAASTRLNLYKLIDDTHSTNEPIKITGKRGDTVLISDDNWRAIQETLYLLSIPNMLESIIEGANTKTDDCSTELDW
ncbi:MAG: type II toxin-antitoxin system Phd/YefM family antitoxin [Bacteroidetes bacterium]|nr:type II toxin-antitoxin system Phd/YefM family antitoxin [Bacteroidota bacterium]MBU1115999.1 type II toxin-antitoxin system Phd/YefM family antitoxin [Bacteroidota bacterium]MBU1799233.1 type II toxin-antitoxin system Phd/YefM family antitoxin [Bacteroidota bacterium]